MRRSPYVLGLVLVAMACQPSTPPPALQLAQCTPTFQHVPDPLIVLRVGEVERVSLSVEALSTCDGVQREPERFDLELRDDNGNEIPRSLDVRQVQPGVYSLSATFTVPQTSFVAVLATAEPSSGRIRRDVAAGHVSTAQWQSVSSSTACQGTIDGPGGVELCLSTNELRVLSSGALLSSQVAAVAMTRERAWVFGGGLAEAWRFDGGTPEKAGSWAFPIVPTSVHSRGTRVVVAGGSEESSPTLTQFDEDAPPSRDVEVRGAKVTNALQYVSDDEVQFGYGGRLEVVDVARLGPFVQVPPSSSNRLLFNAVSDEGIWATESAPAEFGQELGVVLFRNDGGTSRVRVGPGPLLQLAPFASSAT